MEKEIREVRSGERPKPTIIESCTYYHGECHFVRNDPGECNGICPNWKTWNRVFAIMIGYKGDMPMDWFDLRKLMK